MPDRHDHHALQQVPATAFTSAEAAGVDRAIRERRDMRHFCGGSVAPEVLQRLLQAAHHAPSVGFMQPWRFVRVQKAARRQQLHELIEAERLATARASRSKRAKNSGFCPSMTLMATVRWSDGSNAR